MSMVGETAGAADRLDDLMACPHCDTLYRIHEPGEGARAVCGRCHHVLIAPRHNAFLRVVALATTVVILMIGATLFPFLSVNVQGFQNNASVLDAALTFIDGGWMAVLAVFVAGFIVAIPVVRSALIIYVLAPLAAGGAPFSRAKQAFRLAEDLRPWSMAEIFVIGCAVALTKITSLAQVGYGPAFWMFAALVIVVVAQDALTCRWTIWRTLEARGA